MSRLIANPLDSSLRWNDGVVDSSVSRYAGMTGWGLWIPGPVSGTWQALRWNDGVGVAPIPTFPQKGKE